MCDIYLLSVPNRNIDYPALALPTLTGRLQNDGYTVKQTDINIIIKDRIITDYNLSFMCDVLLPMLIAKGLHNSEMRSYFVKLKRYLDTVKEKWGFRIIQNIKEKMQNREYSNLLSQQKASEIVLSIFQINQMLHNYIEYYTKHDNFIQMIYSKHNVTETIATVLRDTIDDIINQRPYILGLTVLEIQRQFALYFINTIRSRFNGAIVIGGADPTRFQGEYLRYYKSIDYVLLKEGEDNLSQLLYEIKNGSNDFSYINGIVFRSNGEIICRPPKPVNVCRFTHPNFDGISLNKYLTPTLPVHASRACYWALENTQEDPQLIDKRGCRFCAHYKTYSTYYERSAVDVVEDMEKLFKKYGTTLFHLTDDALKPTLGVEISKELKKRGLTQFRWLVYARLEKGFTNEVLKEWYDGGVRVIEWGLETASQKILNAMNKAVNINVAQTVLYNSASIGILNKLFMFHNYPGETVEDLKESIDFLEINTIKKVVRPFPSIRNKMFLLKNTSIYNCADKEFLFKKIWKPSGIFSVTAEYVEIVNYYPKQAIVLQHLEYIRNLSNENLVFQTNDENVMLDLVFIKLDEDGIDTFFHVK